MAPPVFSRVDIWSDLACFGGVRQAFLGEVLSLTTTRTVDNRDRLTMVVGRTNRCAAFLVKLAILRLVFSDTTYDEEWRITGIDQDQVAGTITVRADWPLIDLGTRALLCSTPALVTDDQAPYAFEGIGLTPAQHWDNYVTRGFPAAWTGKVGRGTFDVNTPQDLVYDWDKPRKIIGDLATLTNTEISYRRNASTSYLLDLLTAIGSSASPLDVRLGKNLIGVTVSEDENQRATTVFPRSALVDGVSYGLAQNRWQIAAMNSVAKTIDLVDPAGKAGPIAFDHQFGTTGLAWRVFKANGPPVSASNRIITDSAVANQRLTVSVDPTLIFAVGDWLCFGTVDGSGNYAPIWSLNDGPQAIADPPVAVLKRDDVVAGINLVPNPVMRTWTGGAGTAPDSWIKAGGCTLIKRTTAADYLSGGQSLRIQSTGNGQGVYTALQNVTPTSGQPYFTAYARFRIDALTGGAKIQCILWAESFSGPVIVKIYPNTWGAAQSAADSDQVGVWVTLAISTPLLAGIGSCTLTAERLQLQIVQEGTGTADFTVDAAQITQTSYQLPLIEGASGNVLWQAANEEIAATRGAQREYQVDLLDLASSDPTAFPYDQLQLGQTLRVTDADLGLSAVSLRCLSLTRQHITDGQLTPAKVQVTVGQVAPTASSFLSGAALSGRQGTVSGVAGAGSRTGNAPVLPPDFSTTLAALGWFNVKDPAYGAVGDGSTNDTAAIVAANAAAVVSGGTVYFPHGTYLCDVGTLKIDSGSYLAWVGDGDGAAVLKANAAGTGALLEISTTGRNVLIDRLRFLGNGLTGASGHGHAIAIINHVGGGTLQPQHTMIRDVEAVGFRGNALDGTGASMTAAGYYAYGATVHAVENSFFFQCGRGIHLTGMFKHQFFGTTVDQCDKNAVYVDTCENVDFHGCTLNGSGAGGADDGLLHVRNSEGCNMFGGRLKNGNPYLVNLAGTTYTNRAIALHDVSCEQLDVTGGTTAICVSTGTEGFTVEGCPFLFVNTMTTAIGIKLIQGPGGYSAVGHAYERNTFTIGDGGTITACVWLAVASNKALGVLVAGNVIGSHQAHGVATTITAGILLDNNCEDAFVSRNAFVTSTNLTITDAIKLATANVKNAVLYGNTFTVLAGAITTQVNNAGGVDFMRFEAGVCQLPVLGSLSVNNRADATLNVPLQAGSTADQIINLLLRDKAGATKYTIQKSAGNLFAIVDSVNGQNVLTFNPSGNSALSGVGTGKVQLNTAGGSGGVEFYDGVGAGPTLVASVSGAGRFTGKRIIGNGTAHVAGDYAASAGFGSTASVTVTGARDSGGRVSVASSGTGQAANPTLTLTFKDGTWTTAPSVVCQRGDTLATAGRWALSAVTATTATFTFVGTPVAGETYILDWTAVGK